MRLESMTTGIRSARRRAANLDVEPLVAILALIAVWIAVDFTWTVVVPVKLLVLVGLIFSSTRTDPRFWCVTTALLGASLVSDWAPKDNHQFLIVYLSLALFCIYHIGDDRRRDVMVLAGRYLIGTVMALAVVWKVISPDYLNGDFFHYKLLTRDDFATPLTLVGDMTTEMLEAGRRSVQMLSYDHFLTTSVEPVTLESSDLVATIADVVTWWTIGIEALIAFLFLWPRRLGGDHWLFFYGGHLALLLFIVTTYFVAPVYGFAWALIILALANCARRPTLLRAAYLALFIAVKLPVLIATAA